jgi:hypothetical protein
MGRVHELPQSDGNGAIALVSRTYKYYYIARHRESQQPSNLSIWNLP